MLQFMGPQRVGHDLATEPPHHLMQESQVLRKCRFKRSAEGMRRNIISVVTHLRVVWEEMVAAGVKGVEE